MGGIAVKRTDVVRDLGVWMNSTLSFDVHIKKRCQLANHQLNNLKSSIRILLNKKSAETLVHGLIHSCLDFCNGLFVNLPNCQLDELQKIQNRAARIVTRSQYDHPSKPLLKQLHWLPVRARINFKIAVTVFKCLNNTAPTYLSDMLSIDNPAYALRSAQSVVLRVPRTQTVMCERSFHVMGPKVWNSLPHNIRESGNEAAFRRQLKTFLFRKFL